MPDTNQSFMHRCIELARKGAGSVAPNPLVGAVLVHEGRIIGEGFHEQYGQAHAEVNCLGSVSDADRNLIALSVLYVSLEPCAHFGKTPPCSDLIIKNKIPKVVIGCRDPFTEVDGKGIEKLQQAGVEVVTGVLEKECLELNKRFITSVTQKRPYIILKWAQTADKKIAGGSEERLLITNEYTNRLVHQWRSEEAAILVGTNTALHDDPSLTNRLWTGKSPVRMVLDLSLRLPNDLQLFNRQQKTIVFNTLKEEEDNGIQYIRVENNEQIIQQIVKATYELNLQSIIVEGGAHLLQSFIDAGFWDEARIITNGSLTITDGLSAPLLTGAIMKYEEKIATDTICYFINQQINK